MLKNYFKIAWRNSIKNPFYSVVNIVGLTAGILFSMLVAAYVWNELQVNKGLKNAGNQFIIQSKWKDPSQGYELASLGPLAKALRENYPHLVANYYRYDGITSNVSKGDKSFREGIQVGDSTMLNMYGFKLLHGDSRTAMNEPFTTVITSEKAIKYFGKTDVTGQTITIENFSGSKHEFIITGVLYKLPRNSVTYLVDDYPNDMYVSSANLGFFGRNMQWDNVGIAGYVELQDGVTREDLEKPLQYLVNQHAPAHIKGNLTPYLVSLKEYYLVANNGLVKKMLYALSGIALFILLMAIINFINMAVSRSATRMREIGIRKVLGGLRRQLILQFLTESIILVSIATLIALAIYPLTRDLFSNMLGKEIPSLSFFPIYFILIPAILAILIGLLAGIYPAFVLSSLKSVDSLKGKLKSIKERVWLRKSLVAFQFCIGAIVFTGTIIISKQIKLFFSKDLGYNKDYIISAQVPRDWTDAGVNRMLHIRGQFATLPQVSNATLSYEVPDGNNSGTWFIYKAGADSASAISTQELFTDEYYAATYSVPMAAGVFFSPPGALSDSLRLVINETESKALGWENAQDAVGKQLKFKGNNSLFTVAGVTKDFHFGSMQHTIKPVTFLHVGLTNAFRFFSFKVKPGDTGNTIAALQKQWSVLLPGAPFEYKFMDDTLKKLYKSELQLSQASRTATVLSFIIVLLGVIGLVSLSIQKRTKEIGIRKVLGSTVSGIISLFLKEFLIVIGIAGLIACPLAWFIMQGWLNDYAYRISLTVVPFIISVASLAFITAILITVQTIKAGLDNPVKSLRTE